MIVVLTYDHPHRKTQDLILRLLALGIKPMVVSTQWVERKNFQPIITHRPGNLLDISLSEFCHNLNLNLIITTKQKLYDELNEIPKIDFILLATGNIIEKKIVLKFKVINSHPGFLPNIKGLDALKWAILYKEIVGVTTHFVNEQIDGGIIIERREVPLFYADTFHNFAYRQYEMEIEMLVNSISYPPENLPLGASKFKTFRRMPHRLEGRMLEMFEELKKETSFRANHIQ